MGQANNQQRTFLLPTTTMSMRKRLWRARGGIAGAFILGLVLILGTIGPSVIPNDPLAIDLSKRLLPPWFQEGGSSAYPLGTDHLGRDEFARLIYGMRISLIIGASTVLIAGSTGSFLGLVAGYRVGFVDAVIMAVSDVQQAFPFLALAITVVAVLGPSTLNTIVVLGLGGWVLFTRIIRGEVLKVSSDLYIEAARSVGASDLRIMLRHILPNIASCCIIMASFAFSLMVVTEASLSFIGLGVQPPTPSWGSMLADSRNYLETAWWLPTMPGLAIMLTVLGINMFGDWLRDALDPRLNFL